MSIRTTAALLVALLVTAGCAADADGPSDLTTAPKNGVCRLLTPQDISKPTNDTDPVSCNQPHTAETFVVGAFTDDLAETEVDDAALGQYAYTVCQQEFMEFLGGDESLVKRSTLTWAWFRPSEEGWENGARWFRCDAVGGGEQSKKFVQLPKTVRGVLLGRPDDRWLVCAEGPTVAGSVKVPCNEPHDWRAISTIVLGRADDAYPGDREVEVKTREFCSDQVGAYLNYPVVDYEFGYTWFHEGEWNAGNRRSVCWAKTDQ